jgi:hypothetical protein
MITLKPWRPNVPPCMRAGVKRGNGARNQVTSGMSMTGRIHILASHATMLCLLDCVEPSIVQTLRACLLSYPSIVCSRNWKSILEVPVSQRPTGIASSGQLANSRQHCGTLRYVYFKNLALRFVCAEHGFTPGNRF